MSMASLARLLIRTFCVLLMAVFGTVASFAAPGDWMRISYPVVAQELSAQPADLTNSARAPPTAIANVMATGTAFAQTGNLRALDCVETHLASFGFGVGLDAPNTGIPDSWRPISGVGAQVNTPRGFTSYATPDGQIVHVSPSGLRYGSDPKFGNRVDHVLDHTAPNPGKPVHSVFNAQGDDALDLVDQAWVRRGTPDPTDPFAYVVDMGRPIGTAGETKIRIVTMTPGGSEVRTAYPWP